MKKTLLLLILLTSFPFLSPRHAAAQRPIIPDTATAGEKRLDEVMRLIDGNYVESPDMDKMSETAINAMLKALDPHSVYIAARNVERANEGLQGNFEGVGISFQIVQDTIVVASVIDGGPSEKVGIQIGDKLIRIDGDAATGDSIDNQFVFKHLRGKKGTTVVVDVLRQGTVYTFHIVRDKVPIYSIDTWFMADDSIGYVRLIRFARTSGDEFRKALKSLKKQGMTRLILDLRGNTGGYLDIACQLANEFLDRGQLIVYQQGRRTPRQDFRANGGGNWKKGETGGAHRRRFCLGVRDCVGCRAGLGPWHSYWTSLIWQRPGAAHVPAQRRWPGAPHHGTLLYPVGPLHPASL